VCCAAQVFDSTHSTQAIHSTQITVLTSSPTAPAFGRYYLQRQVAFNVNAGDPTYVFDLASCPADPNLVAASGSNHRLKVYDRSTLRVTSALPSVHSLRVTGLAFGKGSPHMLWSCSQDNKAFLWDLRTPGAAAQTYDVGTAVPTCLGVSCDDGVVGVGCEAVEGEVGVLMFDVRTSVPQVCLVM
jgi:WD40 repeat protein